MSDSSCNNMTSSEKKAVRYHDEDKTLIIGERECFVSDRDCGQDDCFCYTKIEGLDYEAYKRKVRKERELKQNGD